MKRLLVVIFITIPLLGYSQTSKKDWLTGGGFEGAYVPGSLGLKSYNLSLSPDVGYFVFNKFAFGFDGHVGLYGISGIQTIWWLTVGPFVRYYIGSSEKMKILTYGSFAYAATFLSGGTIETIRAGAGAGPAIFLNDHVAMEVLLNFNGQNLKANDLGGVFSLSVGFQMHLLHKSSEE